MDQPNAGDLVLSAPTAADVDAATEVVAALEASLYGSSEISPTDLEEDWADLDLGENALVVRDGERIVGYCAGRPAGEIWQGDAYVHPEAHGRGIGRLLAGRLEADARRHGMARAHNRVLEADASARGLLESLDYTPVRVFREMRVDLESAPAAPVWPGGVRVTAFHPDRDAVAFHAAHQEAFADHWEYEPRDFDSWRGIHLDARRFDPALWCVVRDGDEIAAGAICAPDTYGGGFVHVLFTRRPWRNRGVGGAMLADVFGRFWTRGERRIGLGVDAASETGAFRLYERAGMSPALGWVVYEKPLTGAP